MSQSDRDPSTDAQTTTDPAAATLRRIFGRECHEVRPDRGGALGDYEVRFTDACISAGARSAVKRAGFSIEGIHAHVEDTDAGTVARMSMYVTDTQGGA
jgi:hypothetical protein